MCKTCGLPLPEADGLGPPRRYCTAICRINRNRYPRALASISALVGAAIRSEDLDRPELAVLEWRALDRAIRRLEAMTERIRVERAEAGLTVPEAWPGVLPIVVPARFD